MAPPLVIEQTVGLGLSMCSTGGLCFWTAPPLLHQEGCFRGLLCVSCRVPVKNPEENNSVVELYVQSVPDNLHTRSLLDLLEQVSFPLLAA